MTKPAHDATSNEDLTDAEMVQRVRRWLSSTKERDIDWRWLLRTCTIAEKALQASPSVIGLEPKEGHCLLQVPQQTKEKPSPCAMAGHCLSAESILSAIPAISASGNYPLKFFGSPGPIGTCMGIEIHADRAVPDHTIEVRDSINGRLLGRIINVG